MLETLTGTFTFWAWESSKGTTPITTSHKVKGAKSRNPSTLRPVLSGKLSNADGFRKFFMVKAVSPEMLGLVEPGRTRKEQVYSIEAAVGVGETTNGSYCSSLNL
jgi:hypothetical protein